MSPPPRLILQVLEQHSDEVWHIAFSHGGSMLASASKDRSAVIWAVGQDGLLRARHVLDSHEQPVCYLAWSPDDSMLLTCRWGTGRHVCSVLGCWTRLECGGSLGGGEQADAVAEAGPAELLYAHVPAPALLTAIALNPCWPQAHAQHIPPEDVSSSCNHRSPALMVHAHVISLLLLLGATRTQPAASPPAWTASSMTAQRA